MQLTKLLQDAEIANCPELAVSDWENYTHNDNEIKINSKLFDRKMIFDGLTEEGAPAEAIESLLSTADMIEKHTALNEFTKLLAYSLTYIFRRWSYAFDGPIEPGVLGDNKSSYMLLMFYAALPYRKAKLVERGVPEEVLANAVKAAFTTPVRVYDQVGTWAFNDLPWQTNFMMLDIFLLDRLYFVLDKLDAPIAAYRNKSDPKKVKALYTGGHRFRADGQLSGANGIDADEKGFTSIFEETADAYIGNFIAPMGYVEKDPVKLLKSDWEPVLTESDWVMTIHMPGGEGYTLPRFKACCERAFAIFTNSYKDCDIKGFACDSWLFDGVLQFMMPAETSNIVQIQRQVYIYPQCRDDEMMRSIVFSLGNNTPWPPISELPKETSLQRKAIAFMEKGGKFKAQGMFLLSDDLPRFGENTYFDQTYFEEFSRRYGVE